MNSKSPDSSIPTSDPNLIMAVRRLRRTLIIWALIFAGMALLSFFALRQNYPFAFLPWFIGALLFATRVEPIYLSLVAVQWGISLITLIPGVSYFIGPDPLSFIFDSGMLEILVLVGVRIVFIFTSFNQFLFYRLLYGSEKMTGASDALPDIPEVIPNRSNRFAALSRILGLRRSSPQPGNLCGYLCHRVWPWRCILSHRSKKCGTFRGRIRLTGNPHVLDHQPSDLTNANNQGKLCNHNSPLQPRNLQNSESGGG